MGPPIAALLGGLFLIVMPCASALSLTVMQPEEQLHVDTIWRFPVTVTADCKEEFFPAALLAPPNVQITFEAPPEMSFEGETYTMAFPPDSCRDVANTTASGTFSFDFHQDAPAFQVQRANVTATMSGHPLGSILAYATFEAVPSFNGNYSAWIDRGPQVVFEGHVNPVYIAFKNSANAKAIGIVRLVEVQGADVRVSWGQADAGPIILDPGQEFGGTFHFTVKPTGWGQARLRVEAYMQATADMQQRGPSIDLYLSLLDGGNLEEANRSTPAMGALPSLLLALGLVACRRK